MARPKGSPKIGGKIKGTPNKATSQAREAIAQFVEGNITRLNNWLDDIADSSPKDAFNCFMSVIEYHIPKLQRQEVSGPDGGPIKMQEISASDEEIINQYIKDKK